MISQLKIGEDESGDTCTARHDPLTGEHGGEEDVVGEGDEAALSQRVKYAVFICKLLSFLGDLLLNRGEAEQKNRKAKTSNSA